MSLEIKNEKNTYLYNAAAYTNDFISSLHILSPYLNKQQLNKITVDLQIEGAEFDEAKYLQAACETSVCASIAKSYPLNFIYEHKVNPPKDVDCSFVLGKYQFNIEIKCPDFTKDEEIDNSNSFRVTSFGRFKEFDSIVEMIRPLIGTEEKPLLKKYKADNKLKDFLVSAHKKFNSKADKDTLNVLWVSCDTAMDMQDWFFYMYGAQGLFMDDSYHPQSEYENVDVVVLSNIYHRHKHYWNKEKINNHWSLTNSFNLIFSNPKHRITKLEAIWQFVDAIPNHSRQFMGFNPEIEYLRIPEFVSKVLLSNGEFYFQESI